MEEGRGEPEVDRIDRIPEFQDWGPERGRIGVSARLIRAVLECRAFRAGPRGSIEFSPQRWERRRDCRKGEPEGWPQSVLRSPSYEGQEVLLKE
jgi:hypothetical protein